MKRLRSEISVEATKTPRARRKCRRAAAPPSCSFFSSSSSTHRNDVSSVFARLGRRQSAAKSHPDSNWGQAEASTRLFISNIAYQISSLDDIIEGTAEVVYERWDDAIAAVRCYDKNISIFGRTWNVQLVGRGKRALLHDLREQKRDDDLEEYHRERQPAIGPKRFTTREALDADLNRYHKRAQSTEI